MSNPSCIETFLHIGIVSAFQNSLCHQHKISISYLKTKIELIVLVESMGWFNVLRMVKKGFNLKRGL